MKILKILTTSIILSLALLFHSCEKEPCAAVTCQNGGTCNEGVCDCPDGYEGLCETEWRGKMLGDFSVVETCAGDTHSFNTTIYRDLSDFKKVYFDDLVLGHHYEMTMTSSNTFDLLRQKTCNNNCLFVSGNGSFREDGTIQFVIDIDGASFTCIFVFSPN